MKIIWVLLLKQSKENKMSILNKLVENKAVTETALKDFSGNGGFINESGVYDMKIEKAFLLESDGGAIGVFIGFNGDAMFEETLWIANRDKLTYFTKDGKDFAMPAYIDTKKINYLVTGVMIDSLTSLKTEQRLIKHFKYVEDPENEGKKKRVDNQIEAEVLADWIGKDIKLLMQMVQKEGWDKDAKKPNGVGALTKEGVPVTDPVVIDIYGADGRTASETMDDKPSEMLAKGLARIEKTPIRMFKPKKPTGAKVPTSASKPAPSKPSIF
jgi:hypothetical protein